MFRYAIASACAAIELASGAVPSLAQGQRTLSVLIENVSNDRTLKLPTGKTKRVPVAP